MTSHIAVKKPSNKNEEGAPEDVQGFDDMVRRHVFQGKPNMRNWRIKAQAEDAAAGTGSEEKLYNDDSILLLPAANAAPLKSAGSRLIQIGQAVAVFATVAWATYATIYILALPGGFKAILQSPLALGGVVATVLAPIALLWLCLATWQRRSDANMYAAALRSELQTLLFPTQEQAQIINHDIQLLVQQAVEMSSSSRAAIKAIQRARQGLRAEIRDFAGVSQKTEFHIDRLAETLNKRASELITLTEQIEKRTATIEKGTQSGIAAWTQAVDAMEGKAENIEAMFAKGANRILEASGQATGQIEDIETKLTSTTDAFAEKINELAGKFANTSEMFEGHAEKLQTVSESVAAEASRLDTAMQTTLQQQDNFEKGTERIATMADHIAEAVTVGVGKISETAENLFTRVAGVEQKLSEKTESIEASTARLQTTTKDLDTIGAVAANKLGEALSMAISGSDAIMNSVRRSREQLEKAGQDATAQAQTLSTDTEAKVANILQATADKVEKISQALQEFDARQKEIEAVIAGLDLRSGTVSDTVGTAIEKIEASIGQLHQGAALIATKADAPVERMHTVIAQMAAHTRDLDEKLGGHLADLEGGTQKARDTVDGITLTLKTHLHDLSEVTGQVTGQARAITETIETQKTGLAAIVAKTDAKIDEIQERLKRQEIGLSEALRSAEAQVESLGDQIFDRGHVSFAKAQDIADGLRLLEEQIANDLSRIHERSVQAGNVMTAVAKTVVTAAETALPRYAEAIEQAEALERTYDRLNTDFEKTAETVMDGMRTLGTQLDDRLDQFDMTSRVASQNLMTFIQDVGTSISDIKNVAEEAGDSIANVQTGVKGHTEDLQLLTDQVKIRIEALQRNLNDYAQEMSETVGRSTAQLQDATNVFTETSRALEEKTESAAAKLQDVSQHYIEEGHRLSMLSEQSAHKAARVLSTLQEDSSRLVDTTRESLADLQMAGDSLSIRAREVDEYIKASVRNTQTYTDELKSQASIVADTSAASVDRISGAVNSLTVQADQARVIGQKMAQHIEVSRQKLADESDRLAVVTGKAVQTAEVAASAFTRQSNTLFKAVQDVAVHAEKIRDAQWRTQREAFLSSSKFVIESLYSLSLDVARHLESDLDTRALKAYQKGDVAAFARHLVAIAPHIPAERAQKKFIDDGEFRNYVQRFIRQFEELLEQAQGNDYGDLLTSVFSTSDIGKLYRILCEVAGRSALIH